MKLDLEAFIHGAMCISYSGRCLLSNYFTGRDANRGSCAQSCRWKYTLMEEKRPGEYFPVFEDERGTYIFNSKDMCMIEYLPELINSGINSFKVEGRMKSVHYVASVIKVYRQAIDSYYENSHDYQVKKEWIEELNKGSHREYSTGFYLNKTTEKDQIYGNSSYLQTHDFIGLVLDYDENGNPIRIIDRIFSIRLLEELISYNRKGNFDLVSSLFMCMFQVQEEVLGKEYNEKKENNNVKMLLEMVNDMYKK